MRSYQGIHAGIPKSVYYRSPCAGVARSMAYTTNIATPATNMATVVTATTIHPRRELGWPCISFLSAATIRIATRRKGASNPLRTAVQ